MRVVLVDILALVDHNRPDVLLERVEVEPSHDRHFGQARGTAAQAASRVLTAERVC